MYLSNNHLSMSGHIIVTFYKLSIAKTNTKNHSLKTVLLFKATNEIKDGQFQFHSVVSPTVNMHMYAVLIVLKANYTYY